MSPGIKSGPKLKLRSSCFRYEGNFKRCPRGSQCWEQLLRVTLLLRGMGTGGCERSVVKAQVLMAVPGGAD